MDSLIESYKDIVDHWQKYHIIKAEIDNDDVHIDFEINYDRLWMGFIHINFLDQRIQFNNNTYRMNENDVITFSYIELSIKELKLIYTAFMDSKHITDYEGFKELFYLTDDRIKMKKFIFSNQEFDRFIDINMKNVQKYTKANNPIGGFVNYYERHKKQMKESQIQKKLPFHVIVNEIGDEEEYELVDYKNIINLNNLTKVFDNSPNKSLRSINFSFPSNAYYHIIWLYDWQHSDSEIWWLKYNLFIQGNSKILIKSKDDVLIRVSYYKEDIREYVEKFWKKDWRYFYDHFESINANYSFYTFNNFEPSFKEDFVVHTIESTISQPSRERFTLTKNFEKYSQSYLDKLTEIKNR